MCIPEFYYRIICKIIFILFEIWGFWTIFSVNLDFLAKLLQNKLGFSFFFHSIIRFTNIIIIIIDKMNRNAKHIKRNTRRKKISKSLTAECLFKTTDEFFVRSCTYFILNPWTFRWCGRFFAQTKFNST